MLRGWQVDFGRRAHRVPMKDGDEVDAFGNWRKVNFWQDGELKRIKRKYNKRQRRQWKQDLRRGDVI